MRRQLCLAVVAFLAFVRSAQASPSYDDGYGGGEAEAQEEGKPCFNDGYGAPCSNDDLVAGAALPYDGRILRIQAIGQEDYGSGSDYGSEDALLPCTCLPTWTSYERVPVDETADGTCGENNHGCPHTPCDDDTNGPWCKVAHSPCLEEESTHLGGWAYCTPTCDTFSWDVAVSHSSEDSQKNVDDLLERFEGAPDSYDDFKEVYVAEICVQVQDETCRDQCEQNPFCSGLFLIETVDSLGESHRFVNFMKNSQTFLDGADFGTNQTPVDSNYAGISRLTRGKAACPEPDHDDGENEEDKEDDAADAAADDADDDPADDDDDHDDDDHDGDDHDDDDHDDDDHDHDDDDHDHDDDDHDDDDHDDDDHDDDDHDHDHDDYRRNLR